MYLALGQETRLETLPLRKTISDQEDLDRADNARLQGERQPARKRRRQTETEMREVHVCQVQQRNIRAMFRTNIETPGLNGEGSASKIHQSIAR